MKATKEPEIIDCQRCGKKCQSSVGNPESRPFRRASQGLCANCAITEFFKTTEPLASMFGGTLGNNGPEVFLAPHMQKQVGRIMETGNCDAKLEEIDWQIVVNQWGLPSPRRGGAFLRGITRGLLRKTMKKDIIHLWYERSALFKMLYFIARDWGVKE